MIFAAVGIIVEPGESRESNAPLPRDLEAGRYRLRTNFRLGPRRGLGWDWPTGRPPEFEVAAAFRITIA